MGMTTERMLSIARGCRDYGGGYRGTAHYDAYQAGIETVIAALEHAMESPLDTQIVALEQIGSAEERTAP